MLSIGRSGIFYQYSLHGYPYELRKRSYIGRSVDQYRLLSPTSGQAYIEGL